MPNWCSNSLTASDAAVLAGLSDNRMFHSTQPIPDELQPPASEVNNPQVMAAYFAWLKDDERKQRCRAKYGHDDWYGWCLAHWGTKWDPRITYRDTEVIAFDTAWSPPIAWLVGFSTRHPDTTFTLSFIEAGCAFAGLTTVKNGMVLEDREVTFTTWCAESEDDFEFSEEVHTFLIDHQLQHAGG